MSVEKFGLHPLVQALLLISAATMSFSVSGRTVVDRELVIDSSTPADDYIVNTGGKLVANGATMNEVGLRGGSLEMSGSSLTATGADGVNLQPGSHAAISANSRVTSDRFGLRLLRTGLNGSSATVTDSYVEGASGGATLSGASTLNLQGSTLVGGGTSSAATLFGDAVLNARNSQLIGGGAGLIIRGDAAFTDATTVVLDGTTVIGQDGSAIVVGVGSGEPAKADIRVGPGSSLQGSNGTILEIRSGSSASMYVDGSDLVGDVVAQAGASASIALDNRASLTGRLENVEALSIANQARWNMVEDTTLGSLTLNGGSVRFGEGTEYLRLSVGDLSGSGTFVMDADFSTGQTDFLDVTGTATGQHSLLVGSSGADPVTENQLHLVRVAAGDATFSLLNGPVDLGAFSYELVQRGNDWFLDGSRRLISPGTASVLALFNTAPTVWYGELSTLRSRMGELRQDEGRAGGWVRAYSNKFNVSAMSGGAYQQVQQGFSLGADAPLPIGDGQWLVGVLAGHSSSDLNLERGASADVKSYYLGLYTTWLDAASGYYFDGVVKLNRFDNSADVTLSDGKRTKGDYDNMGVGVSA